MGFPLPSSIPDWILKKLVTKKCQGAQTKTKPNQTKQKWLKKICSFLIKDEERSGLARQKTCRQYPSYSSQRAETKWGAYTSTSPVCNKVPQCSTSASQWYQRRSSKDRIFQTNSFPIPPWQCPWRPWGRRLPMLPRDKTSLPYLAGVGSVEAW